MSQSDIQALILAVNRNFDRINENHSQLLLSVNSSFQTIHQQLEILPLNLALTLAGAFNTLEARIKTAMGAQTIQLDNAITNQTNTIMSVLSDIKTSISNINGTNDGEILGQLNDNLSSVQNVLSSLEQNLNNTLGGFVDDIRGNDNRIEQNLSVQINSAVDELIGAIGENVSGGGLGELDQLQNLFNNLDVNTKDIASKIDVRGKATNDTLTDLQLQIQNIANSVRGFIPLANIIQELFTGQDVSPDIDSEGLFSGGIDIPEFNMINPFAQIGEQAREGLETQVNGLISIVEKLLTNQYNSFDELVSDYNDISSGGGGLFQAISLGMVFLPIIAQSFLAIGQPFSENIRTLANTEALSQNLGLSEIVRLRMLGYINETEYNTLTKKLGLDTDIAEYSFQSAETPLDARSTTELHFRGKLDIQEYIDRMKALGYHDTSINLIKSLFQQIPPVQDLITMAVREVFTPDVAQRFGQYEGFPEEFAQWAEKQGLTREWATRYWAAHWNLPSPTQLFEMFQRRIITNNDLQLGLRALDIMPFWRERLTELAYNPLTRVDVRRMHKLGVLTEQEVYESYLDIGYSPENAGNMLNFTVLYNQEVSESGQEEIRQLSVSVICRAYARGFITHSEALNRVVAFGYSNADGNLLLSLYSMSSEMDNTPDRTKDNYRDMENLAKNGFLERVLSEEDATRLLISAGFTTAEAYTELQLLKYQRELELKAQTSNAIREKFIKNIITENEAISRLASAGFTPNEITDNMIKWRIEQDNVTRSPTVAMLKNWYKVGLIDVEKWYNELRGLGYSGDHSVMIMVTELGTGE